MTVSAQTPTITYTASGSATVFQYPFRVLAATDLKVSLNDIQQTVGYTVSGVGNNTGGSVTFPISPIAGTVVKLQRSMPRVRTTDYVEGGALRADTLDNDIDRVVMMLQDVEAGAPITVNNYASSIKVNTYTAAQGQTAFTLTDQFNIGANTLELSVNGGEQILGVDYVESSNSSVTFNVGLNAGDVVQTRVLQVYPGVATTASLVAYTNGDNSNTTVQAALRSLENGVVKPNLFTVQPNKTINAPDGSRFVVKGVTMFDYLFVSQEVRANYLYRTIYSPAGKGAAFGISEPTYYARYSYIDTANVIAQLKKAVSVGINLIRVAVEPAIMYATVPYLDASDGKTYPSDLTMLDDIIKQAGKLGVVVQLQNANDSVTIADNVAFLRQLADRYCTNPWVWINPANELNAANGSGNVNNVSVWTSTTVQYMNALRGTLPSGNKFPNPVVINPPNWGNNLTGVVSTLNSNAAFNTDSNLIIGIHVYALAGEANFRTTRLPTEITNWYQYIDQYCIIIDEVGIDNFAGRYDPNIDPSIPSVDAVAWGKLQTWAIDFLGWCWEQSTLHNLNGLTGFMWYAYIPGLSMHDDNTMLRSDGTWTTWGGIYKNNYSAHAMRRLDYRRSLGADYATGAWSTGDFVDGSITNVKLAAGWTAYTPTVTAGTGSLTTVSATGRWIQIAKLVTFQIFINLTTNGTGATSLIATLPSAPGNVAGGSHACNGLQIVNNFNCGVRTTQGTQQITIYKYDGTYPGATGAQFLISGSYEVV